MRTEPIGKTPGCLYGDPGCKRIVSEVVPASKKSRGACVADRIAGKTIWPAAKRYWLINAFMAGT